MEKYLTARQLQERLQVDRITIYRMLGSGRLKGVKVGGQWRFREEDVQDLVALGHSGEHPSGQPSVPLPDLQVIQQLFSDAVEVAAVAVDPEGRPLTDLTNACDFCNLILASEVGQRRCAKSWAALADGMDSAPRLHRCHAGLLYARAIIPVEGKPLATVIAGQVLRDSDPAEGQAERLAELADACALPLPRLREAYLAIQRLDHAHLERMFHLLRVLGVAVCRIGSERQRLASKLDRIAKIVLES